MCLSNRQSKLCSTTLNERTYDARERFSDVFQLLLQVRSLPQQHKYKQATVQSNSFAAALQTRLQAQSDDLVSLPRHKQYSRHIIGTDKDWTGFICRWEPQVSSCIHGHPSFAYYQVIDGHFLMNLYNVAPKHTVELKASEPMANGDCIWQQGRAGYYDNLVHKVSTTKLAGFTLHLFSENPALGQHF